MKRCIVVRSVPLSWLIKKEWLRERGKEREAKEKKRGNPSPSLFFSSRETHVKLYLSIRMCTPIA